MVLNTNRLETKKQEVFFLFLRWQKWKGNQEIFQDFYPQISNK